MRTPTIEVSPDLRDRLKVQAVTEHTTIKKLVERVLKEYLAVRAK